LTLPYGLRGVSAIFAGLLVGLFIKQRKRKTAVSVFLFFFIAVSVIFFFPPSRILNGPILRARFLAGAAWGLGVLSESGTPKNERIKTVRICYSSPNPHELLNMADVHLSAQTGLHWPCPCYCAPSRSHESSADYNAEPPLPPAEVKF
jgi:hypothetical protein